jgi:hypothetical protein
MPNNLKIAGPLLRLGAKNFIVTRPGPGSYVEGEWVNGASTTFPTLISIQYLTLRELMALPEGERTKERVKFYSLVPLQPAVNLPDQKQKGDQFAYNGRIYEVQADGTEDQPRQSRLPHQKGYAQKIEQDQSA